MNLELVHNDKQTNIHGIFKSNLGKYCSDFSQDLCCVTLASDFVQGIMSSPVEVEVKSEGNVEGNNAEGNAMEQDEGEPADTEGMVALKNFVAAKVGPPMAPHTPKEDQGSEDGGDGKVDIDPDTPQIRPAADPESKMDDDMGQHAEANPFNPDEGSGWTRKHFDDEKKRGNLEGLQGIMSSAIYQFGAIQNELVEGINDAAEKMAEKLKDEARVLTRRFRQRVRDTISTLIFKQS